MHASHHLLLPVSTVIPGLRTPTGPWLAVNTFNLQYWTYDLNITLPKANKPDQPFCPGLGTWVGRHVANFPSHIQRANTFETSPHQNALMGITLSKEYEHKYVESSSLPESGRGEDILEYCRPLCKAYHRLINRFIRDPASNLIAQQVALLYIVLGARSTASLRFGSSPRLYDGLPCKEHRCHTVVHAASHRNKNYRKPRTDASRQLQQYLRQNRHLIRTFVQSLYRSDLLYCTETKRCRAETENPVHPCWSVTLDTR